jgi:hypothetical protein
MRLRTSVFSISSSPILLQPDLAPQQLASPAAIIGKVRRIPYLEAHIVTSLTYMLYATKKHSYEGGTPPYRRAVKIVHAQSWGLWPLDPGPRGVELNRYQRLKDAGGVAPARWTFDGTDWWLEEHGLIMEQPTVRLPPGKYLVTGNREVTAVLTIHPADRNGDRRWELDTGATLYDVTHLACRSARYTPVAVGGSCSPANAQKTAFPVAPGGVMPPVEGCTKQDYAVLIVIGVGVQD